MSTEPDVPSEYQNATESQKLEDSESKYKEAKPKSSTDIIKIVMLIAGIVLVGGIGVGIYIYIDRKNTINTKNQV